MSSAQTLPLIEDVRRSQLHLSGMAAPSATLNSHPVAEQDAAVAVAALSQAAWAAWAMNSSVAQLSKLDIRTVSKLFKRALRMLKIASVDA